MHWTINISSCSDVITNSSSELFLIDSNMTDKEFRELLNKQLEDRGYDLDDETLSGEIWMEPGHRLHLDFPVLCNLKEEIKEILYDLFGKENVYEQ